MTDVYDAEDTYVEPDALDDLDLDPDADDQLEQDDLDPGVNDLAGETDEQPARQTRGENRVAAATRIAAEAKAEADALRAELQAQRAQRDHQAQQETAYQRQQRLSMMDPDQRVEYLLNEQARNFESRLAALDFKAEDRSDAAAFQTLCASNPAAAKMKAEVEQAIANERAQGRNVSRETAFYFLLGQKMASKAPAARKQQARQAAAGVARNTARPGAGRSDVQAGDRRNLSEAEARAKRLEGIKF